MMRRIIGNVLLTVVLAIGARFGRADTTPMNTEIPEEKATKVTCEVRPEDLKANPKLQSGEYHYLAWLPSGYHADEKREYPCLFVASPGGDAEPSLYEDRLKKEQWIAICLTEASNNSAGKNLPNFLAAHDDAIKRFRIANNFKFMTGFSGGARTATYCTSYRTGFAGLFLQGAGFGGSMNALNVNPCICVFAVFGIHDSNRSEALQWQPAIPARSPNRFVMADGTHNWASKETVDDAFDFMIDCAYTRHPLPDKAAMGQYALRFKMLLERARAVEGWDKFLALEEANKIATVRHLSADKTLTADVADAAAQLKTLEKDPAIITQAEARAAYAKVRDVEDAKWPMLALPGQGAELTKMTKQAATAYENVDKKYPDTAFGKKAADRAVWLDLGGDKVDKL